MALRKCCGTFKVPRIGLVEVGRLGQRLNVPTQGRRVAQTGDERPSSLTAPGSDPQPGIEPRPHWWEADTLLIGHLSTHLRKRRYFEFGMFRFKTEFNFSYKPNDNNETMKPLMNHVIVVCLPSQSEPEKHNQEKKPTNLKQMCLQCLIIIKSCYFD